MVSHLVLLCRFYPPVPPQPPPSAAKPAGSKNTDAPTSLTWTTGFGAAPSLETQQRNLAGYVAGFSTPYAKTSYPLVVNGPPSVSIAQDEYARTYPPSPSTSSETLRYLPSPEPLSTSYFT